MKSENVDHFPEENAIRTVEEQQVEAIAVSELKVAGQTAIGLEDGPPFLGGEKYFHFALGKAEEDSFLEQDHLALDGNHGDEVNRQLF